MSLESKTNSTQSSTDTPKYKAVECYQCGGTMSVYRFNAVWDMRIDGQLRKVPVFSVPCMRCEKCDLTVTDAGSDDAIMWAYQKYLRENGLNTLWLRTRRWLRRQKNRIVDRYNWYTTRHLRNSIKNV